MCVSALILDGLVLCYAETIPCLNSKRQQRMELMQVIFSPFHPEIKKISTCFFFFARNSEIMAKHNFLRLCFSQDKKDVVFFGTHQLESEMLGISGA